MYFQFQKRFRGFFPTLATFRKFLDQFYDYYSRLVSKDIFLVQTLPITLPPGFTPLQTTTMLSSAAHSSAVQPSLLLHHSASAHFVMGFLHRHM